MWANNAMAKNRGERGHHSKAVKKYVAWHLAANKLSTFLVMSKIVESSEEKPD